VLTGNPREEFAGQEPWLLLHTRGRMAPKACPALKRIATIAFYVVGTLAMLYLALYAYAMVRQKSLTPGEPIHIFRNPDAPDYS
jgi:hypothetical protein